MVANHVLEGRGGSGVAEEIFQALTVAQALRHITVVEIRLQLKRCWLKRLEPDFPRSFLQILVECSQRHALANR